jgi:hypothetical protein
MMKLPILKGLTAVAFVYGFSSVVMAADPGLALSSIRQRAMGGTGVAMTFDEHALYMNPAGLSRATTDFNFPRLRVELNDSVVQNFSKIEKIADSGSSDIDRINTMKELIPFDGGLNVAVSPIFSFVKPDFGIAGFTQANSVFNIQNRVSPRIEASFNNDTVGLIGISTGMPFLDGVKLGLSGGYMSRLLAYDKDTGRHTFILEASEFLELVDNGESINADIATATGPVFNVGLLGDLSTPIGNGTWGIAANNIGATLKGRREITGNVDVDFQLQLPFTSTVGLCLNSSLPFVGDFKWAADYRFVSEESSFFRNLHLGAEKTLMGNFLTLRGGINDGYITGGIGLNVMIFQLHYGYFVQESGRNLGDRPLKFHMVELGFLF